MRTWNSKRTGTLNKKANRRTRKTIMVRQNEIQKLQYIFYQKDY